MENTGKHQQDLAVIRQMMERSSRFLSLSGWSGIFAGIFALLGAALARYIMKHFPSPEMVSYLIADALVVLVLALVSGIYFSWRKSRKNGNRLWSPVTRRLLQFMAIPLLTGGIYSAILLARGQAGMVAGVTLIFYGFALISAGHFTNREAVILGICEIILGMAATIWQGHGLWIWAAGFGFLHILYGMILFYRYDRHQVQDPRT